MFKDNDWLAKKAKCRDGQIEALFKEIARLKDRVAQLEEIIENQRERPYDT